MRKLKAEIDAKLAEQSGVSVGDLRPWHYHDPFFQEAPAIFAADFDSVYAKADILKLCRDFYAGIGLPIDDVIARSDLYEKPGKSPHAFCTDIDREGDVRVLANIVPNEYWMGTMLHELGHSVYSSKNIPATRSLRAANRGAHPDDRRHRHAVRAVLQGRRLAPGDGRARARPGGLRPRRARMLRAKLLVFSRWCQVMFRFEKALYDNPGPGPEHALVGPGRALSVGAPARRPQCARLRQQDPHRERAGLLSQLPDGRAVRRPRCLHAIARDVLNGVDPAKASFVGNKRVGEFLKTRISHPAARSTGTR